MADLVYKETLNKNEHAKLYESFLLSKTPKEFILSISRFYDSYLLKKGVALFCENIINEIQNPKVLDVLNAKIKKIPSNNFSSMMKRTLFSKFFHLTTCAYYGKLIFIPKN